MQSPSFLGGTTIDREVTQTKDRRTEKTLGGTKTRHFLSAVNSNAVNMVCQPSCWISTRFKFCLTPTYCTPQYGEEQSTVDDKRSTPKGPCMISHAACVTTCCSIRTTLYQDGCPCLRLPQCAQRFAHELGAADERWETTTRGSDAAADAEDVLASGCLSVSCSCAVACTQCAWCPRDHWHIHGGCRRHSG